VGDEVGGEAAAALEQVAVAAAGAAAHDQGLPVADRVGDAGQQARDVQSEARSVTDTDRITSPTWVAWATSMPSVT
jgi:hypothetical protein